jgi:hypothetical protein
MTFDFPPHIVPAFGPRRVRSPELTHRCVTRYEAGMSLNDIGYLEKCSGHTVARVLAEAGIAIRKRGCSADSFRFTRDRRRAAYGEEAA